MRARAGLAVTVLIAYCATAAADPKPKPVDIKAIRDQLVVMTDDDGGVFVAHPGRDGRVWYGTAKSKTLYEQVVTGRFVDLETGKWDISVWTPRLTELRSGAVGRDADGAFYRYCADENRTPLTEVTGDKAKAILDKFTLLSSAMIRRPHFLARDDGGVYFYVDVIRNEYGGKGYRVFVGKKGAMKQRPLTDIATDSRGDVFATKTGDLRIVKTTGEGGATITWVKGEKRTQLIALDTDVNSRLIYKDLGVYGFTGNICEKY